MLGGGAARASLFAAAGTTLVKDISAGAGNGNPEELTAVGNTLFFRATDNEHGVELWKAGFNLAPPTPTPDPDPDTSVEDPDVTIGKKLTVKGKELKAKISAGAQEKVTAEATGQVVIKPKKKKGKGKKKGRAGVAAKAKTTELQAETKQIEGGERTILRLKYKGSKNKRKKLTKKLVRAIKKGSDVKLRTQVKFTDEAANTALEKRVSRLKVKKGKR